MRTGTIDPGILREELRLQEAVAIPDDVGGYAPTWSELATVFAHIAPLRAAHHFGAGADHETLTHRITIRFRDDIASRMRFVREGRTFTIVNIHDPDETGRYLVCLTKEEGR